MSYSISIRAKTLTFCAMHRGRFPLARSLRPLRLKSFPESFRVERHSALRAAQHTDYYAATQAFARTVAELLEREHPTTIVSDMSKNLRHGKVFIDWSQNADHKTTVGVYSLRAKRERPFVSMPVKWEELRKRQRKPIRRCSISNRMKR